MGMEVRGGRWGGNGGEREEMGWVGRGGRVEMEDV